MKALLVILVFLPLSVWAHAPVLPILAEPYEVVTIEDAAEKPTLYLGELQDYPMMYEVTSDEPFTLSLALQQRQTQEDLLPLSLIIIRKNDRGGGVTEIARQSYQSTAWRLEKNKAYGLTLAHNEQFVQEVEAGTYRIEVSTPTNQGKYILQFGAGEDSDGYFESLVTARTIQKFYGFSIVKMLTSTLVYYPLGIFFLLFVMHRLYKYYLIIKKNNV